MSTHTIESIQPTHRRTSIGDRFAYGLVIMLVINFGQRIVGIVRNIGFCQYLSDADLGQWALANSFFVLAAPLIVIGLPGSFGKFTEYFRNRLCLSSYLKRVAAVCITSTLVLAAMMLLAKESFAWLIYGSHATIEIIAWTAIALLAQVSYNFVYDVTLSLRQVRVLSSMQFFHGVFFAIFGIVGLSLTNQWMILLPSYAGSCLMGAMVGGWCVWQKCGQEFRDDCRLDHREMWPRILPFAVSLWLSNLLAGSFELSDRYMLLHLSPGGESIGQAMVGQYYCGRIIPNLLTSVALTLSGILLPYLSADWEAGRQHDIQRRLGYVLSLVSLAFTAISVVALLGSPILFNVVFSGRYEAAHSVLHLSLLQCTWASLSMIAGAYLLCAERAKAASVNLLLGLVVNIGLNIPLIRHFGLTGSVVATLIANLVVLSLTIWTMRRAGCHTDTRTLLMLVVPVSLLFGTEFAAICLAILVVIAGRTDWILSHQDRTDIDAMLIPVFKKAHISMASLWPAARE